VLAYDHRTQFEDLAVQSGALPQRLPVLKKLMNEVMVQLEQTPDCAGRLGVLIDGRIGQAALHDATGRGWWIGRPIEKPGSRPLRFDGTASLASELMHWPREQTVKCLVHYHPDDPETLRTEQEEWLQHVWEATRASGHELLLEVIPPKEMLQGKDAGEAVLRTIERFYDIGFKPEWWKVGVMSAAQWQALDRLVNERDPWCRGAVILGQAQPLEQLIAGFAHARVPLVKGFMIGRSVWAEPCLSWLRQDITDAQLKARIADAMRLLINGWKKSRQPVSQTPPLEVMQ
jgi:5-dehydro-2-deoxygluconokinase